MPSIYLPGAGAKGSAFPAAGVNEEILVNLQLEIQGPTDIYPGLSLPRSVLGTDTRLKSALPIVRPKYGDRIKLFDHLATIFDKKANEIYVALRQTMDALMREQQDPEKFPAWLFNTPGKQAERSIYIGRISKPFNQPGIQYVSEYLEPIADDLLFYTLAFFLVRHGIIDQAEFKG